MQGRILVVEDEPIVALDLKQELEEMGLEVIGIAESAEEAIAGAACEPDLALMDVRIVGTMDGIETARELRLWYQVPVVFLTSYSDETTVSRAAEEMPYGYLTKPFKSAELMATLTVALRKAQAEARNRNAFHTMKATLEGLKDGIVMLNRDGFIRYLNPAAETMTGCSLASASSQRLDRVVTFTNQQSDPIPLTRIWTSGEGDGLGWVMHAVDGRKVLVDVGYKHLQDGHGNRHGYVMTLRDASERLRQQAMEEAQEAQPAFDRTPMAMVQFDRAGRITRVNRALVEGVGVGAESLIGRTLTGLSMDPDERIAKDLMHKLLSESTFMATSRTPVMN